MTPEMQPDGDADPDEVQAAQGGAQDHPEPPAPVPVHPREVTQAPRTGDPPPAPDPAAQSSAALSTFLRFHPAMAFFCWLADLQYPRDEPPSVRFSQLRARSEGLYKLCVATDMAILVVASALIIGIAALVAYKAISPLALPWVDAPPP